MIFSVPDQKSTRIARLITEELIPLFGVTEAVLSDRGANLLSHLMNDLCELMVFASSSPLPIIPNVMEW